MGFIDNLFAVKEFTSLSPIQIIVAMILSFIVGVCISKIYQKTHKGFSYSASFVNTLVILCLVTTVIILAIKNNPARAFALVGALSIIRFRTAVKNTRDTSFVFWAVAEGLALGANEIGIAIIGFIITGACIFYLAKIDFGAYKTLDYLVKYRMDQKNINDQKANDVFNQYATQIMLVSIQQIDHENVTEFTYNLHLKDADKTHVFLAELKALSGVSKANLISEKNGARN
jgi:hypothetical protein